MNISIRFLIYIRFVEAKAKTDRALFNKKAKEKYRLV